MALCSPSSISSSEYEDLELNDKVDLINTSLGPTPPTLPLREERLSLGVETVYKAKGVGWSCARKKSKKEKKDNHLPPMHQDKIMSFSEWILWNLTCGNVQFPLEETLTPGGSNTKKNVSSRNRERLMKALTYKEYLEYLNRCQLKQKVGSEFEFLELEMDQIKNEGGDVPRKRLFPSQLIEDKRDDDIEGSSPCSLKLPNRALDLSRIESRLDTTLMNGKVIPNNQASIKRVSFASTNDVVPISKANEEAQSFLPTNESLSHQCAELASNSSVLQHADFTPEDTVKTQRKTKARVYSSTDSASHCPHHRIPQWQMRDSEDRDDLTYPVRNTHSEKREHVSHQTCQRPESKVQGNSQEISPRESSPKNGNEGKDEVRSENIQELPVIKRLERSLSKETVAQKEVDNKDADENESKNSKESSNSFDEPSNDCTSILVESEEKITREQHSLLLAERIMKDLGFGGREETCEGPAPVENIDESYSNELDESLNIEQKKSKVLTNRIMNQLGFGDIVKQKKESGPTTPIALKELPQGYRRELELTDEQKSKFLKKLGYIPTSKGRRNRGKSPISKDSPELSISSLSTPHSKQRSPAKGEKRSTSKYSPKGKKSPTSSQTTPKNQRSPYKSSPTRGKKKKSPKSSTPSPKNRSPTTGSGSMSSKPFNQFNSSYKKKEAKFLVPVPPLPSGASMGKSAPTITNPQLFETTLSARALPLVAEVTRSVSFKHDTDSSPSSFKTCISHCKTSASEQTFGSVIGSSINSFKTCKSNSQSSRYDDRSNQTELTNEEINEKESVEASDSLSKNMSFNTQSPCSSITGVSLSKAHAISTQASTVEPIPQEAEQDKNGHQDSITQVNTATAPSFDVEDDEARTMPEFSIPSAFSFVSCNSSSYSSDRSASSKDELSITMSIEENPSLILQELSRINSMLEGAESFHSDDGDQQDVLYFAMQSKRELAAMARTIETQLNAEHSSSSRSFEVGKTISRSSSVDDAYKKQKPMIVSAPSSPIQMNPNKTEEMDKLITEVNDLCNQIEERVDNIMNNTKE